jgi:hypothetical protein
LFRAVLATPLVVAGDHIGAVERFCAVGSVPSVGGFIEAANECEVVVRGMAWCVVVYARLV